MVDLSAFVVQLVGVLGAEWKLGTLVALVLVALTYLYLENRMLTRGRGSLPGPKSVTPLLGGLLPMIKDATKFWDDQAQFGYAAGGKLSWNLLAGKLIVLSTDVDINRAVFAANTGEKLKMQLHPNAKMLFGPNNMAFMGGEWHKGIRRQLAPMFTKRALSKYVEIQDRVIRSFLASWYPVCEFGKKHVEARELIRVLNSWTSQTVFVGPYLSDEEKTAFCANYALMTEGFLTLPIPLPGFTLYDSIQARKRVENTLADCAVKSKANLRAGREPSCLMDFWCADIIVEEDRAAAAGEPQPLHTSPHEIGHLLLDFLFASQDASTASLTWCTALMADHPDIFARVKEEQNRLRPNDEPITGDMLMQMPFSHHVMKEILRYRPPATLVAHEALEDFPLSDDYTLPKGGIIFPSILETCKQGFTDGDKFDPDRFSEERHEDITYAKYYLTFGGGPHICPGREYAYNHLLTYLSLLATNVKWDRIKKEDSDLLVYLPTIYPKDCLVNFAPLKPSSAQ